MGRFFLLCICLLCVECGDFTLSPYISDAPNYKHNSHDLKKIQDIEASTNSSFKIAVFSDTHDYYDELKDNIKYINSHKDEYAFVIVTGDITNIGLLSEFETFKDLMDELDIPYILTIGNHDLLTNGGEIFSQMFGKTTFYFDFKQTRFILYNNNNWESSYPVPDDDWLENALSTSGQTHNIMFSHVSVLDDARFTEEQMNSFQSMTDSYNVKYQVNGHDHNPDESSFGNSQKVTVGAASKKVFLELSISDGGVSHDFVYP